jgi:U3 small nucleolar RNA-associated protein 22
MAKRKLDQSTEPAVKDVVEEQVEESVEAKVEEVEEDDDEEEEEEEEEKEKPKHNGPPTKKQKKQLQAQDIQVAREAAELFKSNIFKLQIDELMKEVKLKESHVSKIENVLHRVHELISKIPALTDLTLQKAEAHFNSKKVVIPFPDPKPSKVNYTFSYLPPTEVSLVGSFGLKTGINQTKGSSIDVALTMPQELFQPKDYLNYRALYKRAFYIAYLADNLIPLTKKFNLPVRISYHFLNGDILCPTLRLESIKTDNPEDLSFHKTKFTINLIVAFPFGAFDSKKLLPDKNCIRVQHTQDSSELPPTPIYNASILSSTAYDYYLKYLYTAKKTTEAFKDASILGRLWLQQRGMDSSFNMGGFGYFEFAILMSALLNGGGLNGNKILLHGFSSYQLFKGTIKYLATLDLNSGYLSFSSLIGESTTSKYNSDGFNVPTIFDKNVKLNILWKMTKSSYQILQKQASETLALLNDVVKDRFDPILLQKSIFDQMKYDVVLNLTVPQVLFDSFGPLEKISFITFENYLKHKLYIILKNALGNRIHLIHIRQEKTTSFFPINKRKPSSINNTFIIGLSLNPDECEKLVSKGPSNEDEELGNKFRAFWGARASLRRFKDGAIQHCVVWSVEKNEPIVLPIIRYALDSHLHPDTSHHLVSECTAFNNRLPTPLIPSASTQVMTSLTSFTNLKSSFDALGKILTNMDMPLKVKSLLPASSGLRYSSLLQPVPFAVSNPDFWNECIVQFETSTRWPDEISALEKTKTAFLLKVNEILNQETTYTGYITKDESIPFNEDICLLNILTPEGYGFKLRVLTERDEVLYLRAVNNADKQKALLQDVYVKFNQKYLGVVKHTRTFSTLATHFPFYSATVRLFKQWLDSQLLLHHFSDELVELIAMKPFVDPAPYSIPHSVENGFLQILNFIASWNWKEDSLILDLAKNESTVDDEYSTQKLNDKLSLQVHRVIELNFEKIRKNDPSGIKTQFFVGSKDDPSGILWSNELTLPIASRLTALSRIAMQLIRDEGFADLDMIFTPALKDYDFVIKVKTNSLTSSSGILPSNTFKNLILSLSSFPEDITTKYDLIQAYVDDLNKKFGNVILFSTRKCTGLNEDGSNVIGGIFVPTNLAKKKFRVNLGINVKPVEDSDEVVINREAIMNQITALGGDLIQSIKLRK